MTHRDPPPPPEPKRPFRPKPGAFGAEATFPTRIPSDLRSPEMFKYLESISPEERAEYVMGKWESDEPSASPPDLPESTEPEEDDDPTA
jgi:hypothetical protein